MAIAVARTARPVPRLFLDGSQTAWQALYEELPGELANPSAFESD